MTEYLQALSQLSPIVTALLAGVSFFIGLLVARGFIMWLFGINKLILAINDMQETLISMHNMQQKENETVRKLSALSEIQKHKLNRIAKTQNN